MSSEIYTRTPDEVLRYRVKKVIFGVALVPVTLIALANEQPAESARVRPAVSRPIALRPVVTTNEGSREDFPIRWAEGGKGKLKKVGKHSMFGIGPINAGVELYEGEKLVTRSRTDSRGKWKAQLHIKEPGVKTYRADFRRDGVATGRSATLSITLVDPQQKGDGSDVVITNIAPNDQVIAGYFTLRGSAPPGDFVQIYIDSTLIGRSEVDLAGRWSFKPKISGGGRRTFTVVDEITERQFGPLPVFIQGKKSAVKTTSRPKPKPKPKPKIPVTVQGTPLR